MSKETIKTKIEVWISNIEVGEKYYSFNYRVWVNGKLTEGEYSDSHSRRDDIPAFIKDLEDGYATQCALESLKW